MSKPSRRKTREARKSKSGHRLNKQERINLKNKRHENLLLVRKIKDEMNAPIVPHTQALNRKWQSETVPEQKTEYEEIVAAQMKAWQALLPNMIRQLSRMKDPRHPAKLKHKIAVVMFFGLLQFLLRLPSRRAFNEALTTPSLFETLQQFFPEIDSLPHTDTISRLLTRIDNSEIEAIQINLLKNLINNKKFKVLLINGCLPISIDGTQQAVRNGQLQEEGWLLRTINTGQGKKQQQYLYVLEANITFHNGLSIPLLTEYTYLDVDVMNETAKQDNELGAFKRLTDKLKKYFPRRRMIVLLDNLYACESVIANLKEKGWEFMIKLPAKLKALYNPLKEESNTKISIPGQPYYREREQFFHFINDVSYKGHTVHLVACNEKWPAVCEETGGVITKYSEHTWISSQPLSISNVHLLCNLAARNRALIEDNFNTEKNRGYQYEHLFSYNWNAIQAFHLLMRLAHAINAISEFTKYLKKYIKTLGCANTFARIFIAISNCWLSKAWIKKLLRKKPQLRFQFE